MPLFPMILLKSMTGGLKVGNLAWVDADIRKRYLIDARNGSGPIARDWDAKIDKPLADYGKIPAEYSPPKPPSEIKKVADDVKAKFGSGKKKGGE